MQLTYDVIIVGGGIVGECLALTLAKENLNIALVESRPLLAEKNPDKRTIVLAHSSQVILETIGVWHYLAKYATPIMDIHVSDRGNFGCSRISAKEEGISALGYVLTGAVINQCLHEAVQHQSRITVFQPARFESFKYLDNEVQVTINNGQQQISLTGGLLVGADGQKSDIRSSQSIDVSIKDYQQRAILCHVKLKRGHQNIAYERFTTQGPLALLPINDDEAALVWTVNEAQSEMLMRLSEQNFVRTLQRNFGYRLGKIIHCTERSCLPLFLMTARKQISPGLVLLGNSAHSLHPVAGQGLNLAFRDLAVLAEEILSAKKRGDFIGNMSTLDQYMARRFMDQKRIINLTDNLIGFFSNSILLMIYARSAALVLLDKIPSLKRVLTRQTLGLSGKVPRLACGMTIE